MLLLVRAVTCVALDVKATDRLTKIDNGSRTQQEVLLGNRACVVKRWSRYQKKLSAEVDMYRYLGYIYLEIRYLEALVYEYS